MTDNNTAILMVAPSEGDSDMLYATRFFVPDSFIYVEIGRRKIVAMSDLEVDRAREQAKVDEVLSTSVICESLRAQGTAKPTMIDIIDWIFKEHSVNKITVPAHFSILMADKLRARGYTLEAKPAPFFAERAVKSAEEIAYITHSQRCTEEAVEEAINIIKAADIKGDQLIYEGEVLTSEYIKKVINVELMKRDCIAAHTIVASGKQGCDPHNTGSGPLYANTSIIMDVFPHSTATHYFADMSRTVCRGKASDMLKRMYDAVFEGQAIGLKMVAEGVNGGDVHEAIVKYFDGLGFKTGLKDGRIQGFFHGTGHGVGLDIHEEPRVSPGHDILKAGQVVTVEPGLYYLEAGGGIRLEDMVVVTADGNTNLTHFPKHFEI